MREAHWRPLAVRYWQRSGVRAGLGDVVFMESFFIFHHFENLSGGGLYPPVLQKRGWKMLKTNETSAQKRGKRLQKRAREVESGVGNLEMRANGH